MLPARPRHPDFLTVTQQLDVLTEQHLGLGRRPAAERLHTRLQRLHLTVVVGAPDVDEVAPAACDLVAVVREVVAEVRRRPVGAHEHSVARIAEVGGTQPARAVLVEHDAPLLQHPQHVGDIAPFVQDALREPRVEVDADAAEVVANPLDVPLHAPFAGCAGRHVVTPLGVQLRGHIDEVLALVSVLGRRLAPVAGDERVAERVELVAGVVQVVLAVHHRALRGEQIGDRVAHCDPAPPTRVQRAGRVDRHELEVDAAPREHVGRAEPVARRHRAAQHVVEPCRPEVEVDEARRRHLGSLQVRHRRGVERGDQARGDLQGGPADRLGQHQRGVGRPVTVVPLLRQVDLHAARRFRKLRVREGSAHCTGQVVANHRSR